MFQVEVAPDAVCQLERLVLKQLEYGGRTEAYQFLRMFERCVRALREDPMTESAYVKGISKRYRAKSVFPDVLLIYQVDEDSACVKIDGVLEDCTEISN